VKAKIILVAPLVLAALSMSILACHAQDYKQFRDLGISADLPVDWKVSSWGSSAAGGLSILGTCSGIYLNWSRDPGISPEEILARIKKTYDSEEVTVTAWKQGAIAVQGQRAATLDLNYTFRGFGAHKRFVAWNSSFSDRLFLASFSGCPGEMDQASKIYDRILASFSDERRLKKASLGPRPKDEAWATVLRDLLCSYHYIDARTLPPKKISLEIVHMLQPFEGSYLLQTMDLLSVDPPLTAARRAGALEEMLAQEGYRAVLAERSGKVQVAVQDADGNWQPISVNPSSPERAVGVLVDGGGEAVIYQSLRDLAEDNGLQIGQAGVEEVMKKDCQPSRYVVLRFPSEIDSRWLEDLNKTLEEGEFSQSYRENFFDCSNTSQIVWSFLEGKGYQARLMMSYKGHPLDPHLWVVVLYPPERDSYVAVETANTDKTSTGPGKRLVHLGRVTAEDKYYTGIMYNSSQQYSRLHPEEGMWLVPAE
jgi:hypothetical protein